ncbi:peptidoglycan D,D-transpeptidase FtsI family protein [Streptomyces botrytidirepellens]|uniref:Penicillin-binding protein 2 n=1 Tax=Streptomyces botrytidirepellens TaxID=2486417 RepID=A0A3M8TUU5_9ACTN|nr:penicillin-binding protein 2 [Streptomyces botrytidirepellens]RNF94890.1 penicillin-binding protein 2 [Streptomyces botrytidirepellens]
MNKPLRRIAIFCGLLVLALLVRDNWIQYVQADGLKTHKQNRRVAIAQYSQPRGNIIVDGRPITGSKETDGVDFKYKRTYKNGPMWAPVTGYASQAYGSTQIENLEDGILTGNDDRLFFNRTVDMFTGKKPKGGDVITTLNAKAQEAAYKGLGKNKGAVAALDPRTGKVLALVSTPSYDPSKFAGSSKSDEDAWKAMQGEVDEDNPTLNRALRQTYPPGSTFKVVTAAAALENGKYTDIDGATNSPLPWRLPLSTQPLRNEGNIPCENATLRQALRYSCNTVFGKLGDDLGKDKMLEEAKKFGFNDEVFMPVRAAESVYPEKMDRPGNALSSIGQFDTRATPLQMAMVAAGIANDGKLMKPYMIDSLRAPNLNTVDQTSPEQMSQPLSSENAGKLQDMMETVVKEGTGTNAQIPGATVGGKTGTAQHGVDNSENPYAWFISYAKTDEGSPVAVAVVVESSDTLRDDIAGGKLAAPIAKDVMKAVLDSERDK